ncbi:hypothetical protein BM536_011520 [Streptomyces phaeoluteigriseus]|uniref:Uncharacterized protein n=1 Tax=Streptomyces phaeoluteigriseus TaxID=114686 RepID=A0A1V6MS44_9ACTN|nr:hypothetical protein BM536_011520 [Streptomyces phaeoluteigriseus]
MAGSAAPPVGTPCAVVPRAARPAAGGLGGAVASTFGVGGVPEASPAVPPSARRRAPCCGRGCVSQATAAPVTATGHSTTPATPSTPAPV